MTLKGSFKRYVAPHMSEAELHCLLEAVEADDPALVQGATTLPRLYLDAVRATDPCEGACAIALPQWRLGNLRTVGEVRHAFDLAIRPMPDCLEAFLDWFDTLPRVDMLAQLSDALKEVLSARATPQTA